MLESSNLYWDIPGKTNIKFKLYLLHLNCYQKQALLFFFFLLTSELFLQDKVKVDYIASMSTGFADNQITTLKRDCTYLYLHKFEYLTICQLSRMLTYHHPHQSPLVSFAW